MNNRGQLTMGGIVVLAMALILGGVFAVAIADNQAVLTTTRDVVNVSQTSTTGNYSLLGQATSNFVAFNSTNATGAAGEGVQIGAGNYSTTNYVNINQVMTSRVGVNATTEFSNANWLVSYTYEPLGYNTDASSRTVAALPLLFFTIIVLLVAFGGIKEWLGK